MVVGIILIGIVAGSISAVVTLITGAGFLAALLAYSGVGAGAVLGLGLITYCLSLLRDLSAGTPCGEAIGRAQHPLPVRR